MHVSRALIASLVVASAILSGCTARAPSATPVDTDTADDAPAALTLPWTIDACRFVTWFVPVDADALQAHLPDDLEPVGFGTARGGIAIPGAYLGFEASACDSGSGLEGSVSGLQYGSVFTSVRPVNDADDPARRPADQVYFKWSPLIPDAARRAWLTDLGADVTSGDADPGAIVTPAGTLVRASLTLDNVGIFSLTGGPARETAVDEHGTFIEYSRTSMDVATWSAGYALTGVASGVGTFEVQPGSWPHALIGVDRGTSQFLTGTWSFQDGSVSIPAPTPGG